MAFKHTIYSDKRILIPIVCLVLVRIGVGIWGDDQAEKNQAAMQAHIDGQLAMIETTHVDHRYRPQAEVEAEAAALRADPGPMTIKRVNMDGTPASEPMDPLWIAGGVGGGIAAFGLLGGLLLLRGSSQVEPEIEELSLEA